MAEERNLDAADKTNRQLVQELTSHVESLGLSVMLRILKVKDLKDIAKLCEWEEKKIPTGKATIAKKIQETIEDVGPRKFLEKCDGNILRAIMTAMTVDPPSSRKDYVDFILQTADAMGMENFISSFPTTKIKEFVKHCKLKTDSDSLDVLLRALIEQESIKAYYEPSGDEKASKSAPDINKDENISGVDLHTHFYRQDIADWCDAHGLISHGSKKELVERYRRFVDGKLEDRDSKKERSSKKKAIRRNRSQTFRSGGKAQQQTEIK